MRPPATLRPDGPSRGARVVPDQRLDPPCLAGGWISASGGAWRGAEILTGIVGVFTPTLTQGAWYEEDQAGRLPTRSRVLSDGAPVRRQCRRCHHRTGVHHKTHRVRHLLHALSTAPPCRGAGDVTTAPPPQRDCGGGSTCNCSPLRGMPFGEEAPRIRRHRAAAGKPALERLVTRMSPAHEKAGVSNHSFDTPACGVAVRAEGGGPRDYQWSS
jgi:hypothetical protein